MNNKKGGKVIKLNQTSWSKPYINMNTEADDSEEHNFKLINNRVFRKNHGKDEKIFEI